MKLFNTLSSLCVATLALAMTACGGAATDSVTVVIPDSASVGRVVPQIKGEMGQYYKIAEAPYALLPTDSGVVFNINVIHTSACSKLNAFSTTYISDGDTASATLPYIVLVDSMGQEIPSMRLTFDKALAPTLTDMLVTRIGSGSPMRFVAAGDWDMAEVSRKARNFHLYGGIAVVPDTAKISRLIQDLSKQSTTYSSKWHNRKPGHPSMITEWMIDRGSLKALVEDCESALPYMAPAQEQNYKKIKVRIPTDVYIEDEEEV